MKKSKNMKQAVHIDWMENNQVKIKNSIGTKIRTHTPLDLDTWRFKVLGKLPKGKKAIKILNAGACDVAPHYSKGES